MKMFIIAIGVVYVKRMLTSAMYLLKSCGNEPPYGCENRTEDDRYASEIWSQYTRVGTELKSWFLVLDINSVVYGQNVVHLSFPIFSLIVGVVYAYTMYIGLNLINSIP